MDPLQASVSPSAAVKGFDYIERLAGALISERLVRDLERLDKRGVDVIELRPRAELRGNAFSALVSRSRRAEYIADGRRCARAILDAT